MRAALVMVIAACAEPHPDSECFACDASFASLVVEVVQANGQPALGLDAKTVHVASGTIVFAVNDNPTGAYTIADDNTSLVSPAGTLFRFSILDDSVELASRDVIIGADECGCHIEPVDVPMRIVLP